jgi:AcrR family transcriptional regulator
MVSTDTVIDSALLLAKSSAWESFSLTELAETLNISLAELSTQFRSKDDIAEAFFDRIDQAMLKAAVTITGEERERLEQIIFIWFEQLAPNKTVVKEMLGYKLEPGHIHLQAHGVTRISRTVQWYLNAAQCSAKGLERTLLEVGVSSAYLASFATFLFDHSDDHQHTRNRLQQLLALAYRVKRCPITARPMKHSPKTPD